jgi:hypothetical protein
MAAWKIAPALRAGNTVVLKPSPFTPLSSLAMGQVLASVLPPGVLNVVSGGDELGGRMTEHPAVRKISFTEQSFEVRAGQSTVTATVPDFAFRMSVCLRANAPVKLRTGFAASRLLLLPAALAASGVTANRPQAAAAQAAPASRARRGAAVARVRSPPGPAAMRGCLRIAPPLVTSPSSCMLVSSLYRHRAPPHASHGKADALAGPPLHFDQTQRRRHRCGAGAAATKLCVSELVTFARASPAVVATGHAAGVAQRRRDRQPTAESSQLTYRAQLTYRGDS